jgi:hypothetical protein
MRNTLKSADLRLIMRLAKTILILAVVTLAMGVAAGQPLDTPAPLNDIKQFQSNMIDRVTNTPVGELITPKEQITLPWASGKSRIKPGEVRRSSDGAKEEINMIGANAQAELRDINAINAVKERDVTYEGVVLVGNGSKELANSVDISVTGVKQSGQGMGNYLDNLGERIEMSMSSPFVQGVGESNDQEEAVEQVQPKGVNSLNIDISGISSTAINTAPNGNAVVNSNIIIKPVQIIVLTPEQEEKVRQYLSNI